MSDLLPCPFCGEPNVEMEADPDHRHWPAVRCNECGALGPSIKMDHLGAKEDWNTRSTRPALAQQPLHVGWDEADYQRARDCMYRILCTGASDDPQPAEFDNAFQHAVGILALNARAPALPEGQSRGGGA